ncbi:hypothetical protein BDR22DRAFT_901014 [Usnea florida]
MTCSTAAFLQTASSLPNPISSLNPAINAGYGILHGGAIKVAYKNIAKVGSVDNVPRKIETVKSSKERLFRYGHRIYKVVDPRSIFIREILEEFGEEAQADPLLKVALEIDRIASTDEHFTSRQLNHNADLFASFAYKAMSVFSVAIYQFASPVRWIETQDVLFSGSNSVERYIEIGPANILGTMAKKTIASKYAASDRSGSLDRQILSFADNMKEIYSIYPEEAEDAVILPESTSTTEPEQRPSSSPGPKDSGIAPTPTAPPPAASVSSAPIGRVDTSKLKKPFEEVRMEMSIKDLSMGKCKSTLQNELLGDLGIEFGSLPDSSEERSLVDLGDFLSSSFLGTPGKHSASLIAKMISSKMPAGFNLAAARKYLKSRWGLDSGRQNGVLLMGIAPEPISRLSDDEAARGFFDLVVNRYAVHEGIVLSTTDYLTKQLRLLAKFLKIGLLEHRPVLSYNNNENEVSPGHVPGDPEHGEVYEAGIMPIFDPRKMRHYDSWWNGARKAVISLFFDIQTGTLSASSHLTSERCARTSNRSHPTLIDLIQYLITTTAGFTSGNDFASVGQRLYHDCQRMVQAQPVSRYRHVSNRPKTVIESSGLVRYSEVPREVHAQPSSYVSQLKRGTRPTDSNRILPLVHLKITTETYLNSLQIASDSGYSFQGKIALVTGAGAGSIGTEIVKGLLEGGTHVIVTSSQLPSAAAGVYQSIYTEHSAKESSLTLHPFNQGSVQDCEDLIKHIYDESTGLGQDLDIFVPFAAISEDGRELDGIDDRSELAHRVMLINTHRVLGYIKTQKHQRGFTSRPTQVILPLSPNHGTFGGDGLYSESKLGLETIFNRWSSESWGAYLIVCGAEIGWTRGTGLMNGNNIVAELIESHDVITFARSRLCGLNGGLQRIPDLKKLLSGAPLHNEVQLFQNCLHSEDTESIAGAKSQYHRPRANLRFDFPKLPVYESTLEQLSDLKGMVDLSRVAVVVGYSELGPWGNARTRWEMEAYGEFTREGFVEMAWIMGLIKHFDGQIRGTNTHYTGWVDSKTGEAFHDDDIGKKYGTHILEHSGVRFVEPELFHGYNPTRKESLQEIAIEEDLEPFEGSKATAEAFALRYGDNVVVTPFQDRDEYSIVLKRGATLLIPKAVSFNRLVAGHIPSGWDPRRYGITDDIVSSVDPVTIYILCAVAEALLSAGITDPYELYRYIHLSEIGIFIGSGAGGVQLLRGMYRDRWIDLHVQKNVNMLLLGSTGPIRSPVGACATAIESLDIGVADITCGKVKMCLVGGTDDFSEELSQEFANMQATSNTEDEFLRGRIPGEMLRPTAATRSGFIESQGSGVQLLASAELALQIGLPIYGIIASTTIANSRILFFDLSLGILTNAREKSSTCPSPLLDITYRRRQMGLAEREMNQLRDSQLRILFNELNAPGKRDVTQENEYFRSCAEAIEQTIKRGIRDIKYAFGNKFADGDPAIAPLRAALAVWNLTIDDSMHGTSTIANDTNESDVIDKQMRHLGRRKGNLGGAGAWMLNGALQALNTGILPGNRDADNIDSVLRKYGTIVYPNKTIKADSLKAFSVTSFGFGQKGGQVIGVHPRYVLAVLEREAYEEYRDRCTARQKKTYTRHNQALTINTIFRAKDHAPYGDKDESKVFLDPNARVSLDKDSENHGRSMTVGVDVEEVASIDAADDVFLQRNFTPAEQAYAQGGPAPQASLAARWCAKEAVFKSLGGVSQGGGAPIRDIEIVQGVAGTKPTVKLHNRAMTMAVEAGIKSIDVSFSHCDSSVVAVALAFRS